VPIGNLLQTRRTNGDCPKSGKAQMSDLWIIIPTYNEAANVSILLPKLTEVCPSGTQICIVDDQSPDGTADVAESLRLSNVSVIRRTAEKGYGRSVIDGIVFALSRNPEFVMTMDADLSHDPASIPSFLAAVRNADLVIGSRYLGSRKKEPFGWLRRAMTWGASRYVRLLSGVEAHDTTSGYRCWRADFLSGMPLNDLSAKGYAFIYETILLASLLGARIREVPIDFVGRIHGTSKMSMAIMREGLALPLRMRLRTELGRSPLPRQGEKDTVKALAGEFVLSRIRRTLPSAGMER